MARKYSQSSQARKIRKEQKEQEMGQAALNKALNDYAQGLNQIDQLETQIQQIGAKVIQDMRDLKNGVKTLDELVVTDNGYEFMPKPELPAALKKPSNSVKAEEKEETKAGV